MKKKPSRDPITGFEREQRAARRAGQGSSCSHCGENRPLALIPRTNPRMCANCQREQFGRLPFDDHHPAGEVNDSTTIPIPVNDHRALLSPQQYEWSPKTWVNPEGSPIRAGAARVRGYCETSDCLVNSLLIPNAEMLEALDEYLEKRLGPKWWVGTEMERFAPKRKRKCAGGVRVCALSRAAKGKGAESEKTK
jgi:hypothetical protein